MARPSTGRPPGRPRVKLEGMTFGALTVLEHAGHNLDGRRLVRCRCVCGARVVVRAEDLSKRRRGCFAGCGGRIAVLVTPGNSTVCGHGGRSRWVVQWWNGDVPRGHHSAHWRGALPTRGSGPDRAGILHVPCRPLADDCWYRVRPIKRLGPRYAKRINGAWYWVPVPLAATVAKKVPMFGKNV